MRITVVVVSKVYISNIPIYEDFYFTVNHLELTKHIVA